MYSQLPRLAKQEKRERSGYLVPCSSRKTSVRVLICSETTPKASTPTHASPAPKPNLRVREEAIQSVESATRVAPPLFLARGRSPSSRNAASCSNSSTPFAIVASDATTPDEAPSSSGAPEKQTSDDNSLSVVERRGEASTLKLLLLLLLWSLTFR